MVEVDCAQCGAALDRQPWRVKKFENQYCDRTCHNESMVTKLEVECDHCGDKIVRDRNRVEQYENHYCDYDCWTAARRPAQVEVECAHCGETSTRPESSLSKTGTHYCDAECQRKGVSKQIDVDCGNCGTTISRRSTDVERWNNVFCDADRLSAWFSENWVGDGHPLWTGENDHYPGPHWDDIRETVLERDNRKCALCGLSESAHAVSTGRSLPVHHMTPVADCDGWDEANAIGNLISVCITCHNRVFDAGYNGP